MRRTRRRFRSGSSLLDRGRGSGASPVLGVSASNSVEPPARSMRRLPAKRRQALTFTQKSGPRRIVSECGSLLPLWAGVELARPGAGKQGEAGARCVIAEVPWSRPREASFALPQSGGKPPHSEGAPRTSCNVGKGQSLLPLWAGVELARPGAGKQGRVRCSVCQRRSPWSRPREASFAFPQSGGKPPHSEGASRTSCNVGKGAGACSRFGLGSSLLDRGRGTGASPVLGVSAPKSVEPPARSMLRLPAKRRQAAALRRRSAHQLQCG